MPHVSGPGLIFPLHTQWFTQFLIFCLQLRVRSLDCRLTNKSAVRRNLRDGSKLHQEIRQVTL